MASRQKSAKSKQAQAESGKMGIVPFAGTAPAPFPIPGEIPVKREMANGSPVLVPELMFTPAHLRREWPLTATKVSAPAAKNQSSLEKATAATMASTATVASSKLPAEEQFTKEVETLLNAAAPTSNALASMASAADAFYDFDEYLFLRSSADPYFDLRGLSSSEAIPADPAMDKFLRAVREKIGWFVESAVLKSKLGYFGVPVSQRFALLNDVYGRWASICSVRAFNRLVQYAPTAIKEAWIEGIWDLSPEDFYAYSLYSRLLDLAETEAVAYFDNDGNVDELVKLLSGEFWETILNAVFDEHFTRIPRADQNTQAIDYPFDPFPSNEILFGLQVVHRQTWTLMGYGRGELVKTIPLGPRETQKVNVKVVTRTKLNRTSEEASSFETTTESSTSSKDTSEVVSEASEKLNKHAEAEVSGGYGPFVQAKVSGGISQDLASSSRQTKNRLNEVMQKTAGRMKRDTKVVVSTEGEETFEVSRSSELTNPNDEMAVTYMYHRLQQRYWVTTGIAEVHSVVFVPEELPAPNDINEDWIRRYGDVISAALLDPGLAGILNSIRKEPAMMPFEDSPVFRSAADAAIGATQQYKDFKGGGDLPDLLGTGQQFHERHLERHSTHQADKARRDHQSDALIAHIRRNILHYMRAIWKDEDFDQRMQRFSKLRVPTMWYFVPRAPRGQVQPDATPLVADGFFTPNDASARPLTDVIDPIGPIGYLFNCAIYRMRDDVRLASLNQALSYMRAAFTRFEVKVTPSAGAGVTVNRSVAYAPRSFESDFILTYRQQRQKWLLPVTGRSESDWLEATNLIDGAIEISGIHIWLEGAPVDRAELAVSLRVTADLEDPHVRLLKLKYPLPVKADEKAFFNAKTLTMMQEMVPYLRDVLDGVTDWNKLSDEQKSIARDMYHDWLAIKESGRLVPLETGNVVLDLETSKSPVLEPFKRLHRYVDVLKEFEVAAQTHLQNQRRQALLDAGNLGDPDIDKVSVITADQDARSLVTISANGE